MIFAVGIDQMLQPHLFSTSPYLQKIRISPKGSMPCCKQPNPKDYLLSAVICSSVSPPLSSCIMYSLSFSSLGLIRKLLRKMSGGGNDSEITWRKILKGRKIIKIFHIYLPYLQNQISRNKDQSRKKKN